MALCRAILMGRIVNELELKTTPSGADVLSFSVACERNYKNQNGEKITDFVNVVAWKNTAVHIAKWFGKGRMICIEGNIETRQYTTQNNEKRTVTEIIADRVHFTGEAKKEETQQNFVPNDGFVPMPDNGDDLPF